MKFKKLTALVLSFACLMSTTAFGATKIEPKDTPVYTYEQVLEKVKRNSSDLKLLEQNLVAMDKRSSIRAQELGSVMYPTSSAGQYITVENYAALDALNTLMLNKQNQTYTREKLNKTAEYQTMSTMASIERQEANLALSTSELAVYTNKYNMANLQHRLGMVSESDKINASVALADYKANVAKMEIDLANDYKNLATLMGVTDTNFKTNLEVEYKPFVLTGTIDEYAEKKALTNPALEGMRKSVENAVNNKSIAIANGNYEDVLYSIAEAEANLKQAEDGARRATKSVYSSLLKAEIDIKSSEEKLATAKNNLTATEINFKEGRATKLQLDEATLNVNTLVNAIAAAKESYMVNLFNLENPCVTG